MRSHFPTIALASLLVIGCSGETEVVTHHPNGMIERKGYFDAEGFRTGKWTTWDIEGRKLDTTTYKNGKRDGVQTKWYENGYKELERTYKNGNIVKD